ncbi:MAG: cysteine dioxygenase [Chlamydiales bacterium]
MTQAPLDLLCADLTAEFRRDPGGSGVVELLTRYSAGQHDWQDCRYSCPDTYSRNLIHRGRDYELLLLCWGEGHESPIHDHAQQSCWMAVLEGTFEEIHFGSPSGSDGAPVEGRTRRVSAGQVAYIEDEIALHLIRPVKGTEGVSLHLYAKPIDSCRVFDPEGGASRQVEVGYTTIRGEPCVESAEQVRAGFLGA